MAIPFLFFLLLANAKALYNDAITYDDLPSLTAQPSLLFITVRWCDHCATLRPEITYLSRATKSNSAVLVARADADDEPAIPARFGITGFPSILFFPSGFNIRDRQARPIDYTDWRWAEVMAEFVNNATGHDTITLKPRDRFLRWRKNNPWNLGIRKIEEQIEEEEEAAYDDGISRMPIREPMTVSTHNFRELYNPSMRYMALFYRQEDPFLRELRLQWRQASSAFSGAENVTVALADVTDDDQLAEQFNISDTPACRYFPRCETDCEVVECGDDMDNTENIVQFISDRVMIEMGIFPEEGAATGRTYTLTEEQYQQMKADGVVFANDDDSQERVQELYEERARQVKDSSQNIDDASDKMREESDSMNNAADTISTTPKEEL